MQTLTFTNIRGMSITLGNSAPFILSKISDEVDADIQTNKAPYQDGSTLEDVILGDRTINIEGAIATKTAQEMYTLRAQLSSVFNPKYKEGTLLYTNDAGTKEIKAVAEKKPIFNDKYDRSSKQLFTITLTAPSTFWLEQYTESEEMADWIGGLQFTLQLPMMFGQRSSRVNKIISNLGDVDTPITFEFLGPALNPKIIKVDTGEYIKINKVLAENEKLIITTDFGMKKVNLLNTSTGIMTNAFKYLDLNSTFFQLSPGDNQLSFDADTGRESAKIWVKWRNRYVGV